MPSTYSPLLRIQLIGQGEQTNSWGNTTNINLGTLIEQSIAGAVTITMADANHVLTQIDGETDQARNALLLIQGTLTEVRTVIAPNTSKVYIIRNGTVGGHAIRIQRVGGGAFVEVPNGKTALVVCDGTTFFTPVQVLSDPVITGGTITGLSAPLPIASGGTGGNTQDTARLALNAARSGINNDITALTGLVAPVPISGGGTGAINAPGARNNLLPSQTGNAGKTLITDGTNVTWNAIDLSTAIVTGALPVAKGGTGATSAATALSNLGAAPSANPTFTGTITGNGATRGNVTAVSLLNIDCSLGNYFTKTITTGANNFTFSNVPSQAYSFVLELNQVGGTVVWPGSVYWPNSIVPSLTSGNTHLFVFITSDGGTVFHGAALTNYNS